MNRPNLDSPAGKGVISTPIGKQGILARTPQGGYSADKPVKPDHEMALNLKIAEGKK